MSRNKEKNDKITQTRREEILRVSVKKFSQKGYQGTSVSEIAKELGISQGIVFWYFNTKENLFIKSFMKEFKEIKLASSKVLQSNTLNPVEKLKTIIFEMINIFTQRKEGCMLFLQVLSNTELQKILSLDISLVYSELYIEMEMLFKEAGAANPDLKAKNFAALLDGFMIQIILGLDIGKLDVLVNDILHRYELI